MNAHTVVIEVEPTTAAMLKTKAAAQGVSIDALLRTLAEAAEELKPGKKTVSGEQGKPARKSLFGAFQHMGLDVTLKDMQDVRREMSQNFPREIPE